MGLSLDKFETVKVLLRVALTFSRQIATHPDYSDRLLRSHMNEAICPLIFLNVLV